MEDSLNNTAKIVAVLLLASVASQALYTGLYIAEANVPRQLIWGAEGVLFAMLSAVAGAALVQAKQWSLGWSAIAFAAVFNLVQVAVGVTLFVPFREAAQNLEALAPVAGAVVAFSFFIYNAAKVLLGLAAVVFGRGQMQGGAKLLGGLTAGIGAIAIVANAGIMILGRSGFMPSPVAGASGVLATLLLALCLWRMHRDAA